MSDESNLFSFEATKENFTEKVVAASNDQPVLVIFWASWCGPCKMLKPMLHQLANDFQGRILLATINTEQQRHLCKQYPTQGIPTALLFKNSEVVDRFSGARSKEAITHFIEMHLPHPADALFKGVEHAYQEGDKSGAKQIIQQLLSEKELPSRITSNMLSLAINNDDFILAKTIIDRQPATIQKDKHFSSEVVRLSFSEQLNGALSSAIIIQQLKSEPENLGLRYQLACKQVLQGDLDAALASLLEILKVDYCYQELLARKSMLKIFDILGNGGDLVRKYRVQIAKHRP